MHYHSSTGGNPFSHLTPGDNRGVNVAHTSSFDGNRGTVELILYPPKRMPNQVRRSHLYTFSNDFRFDVQDRLNEITKVGSVMGNDFRYASMVDVPSAHQAVLPSATGAEVNLRAFDDRWTFILISDNFNKGVIGATTTPTRMFYSGWIIDEPVTTASHGGGTVTNPHATLIITHHTKLAIHQEITNTGYRGIVEAIGDYDYLDPMTAQNILTRPEQLYRQDPHSVARCILPSDAGETCEIGATPMVATTNPNKPHIELATDFNDPVSHLGLIVSGIKETVTNSSMATRTDLMLTGSVDPKWGTFASMVNPGFNYIFDKDINPNEPITMSELEYHYGGALRVNAPPSTGVGSNYEVGDAREANKRNVFTSMLSTSLPTMMVNKSIAEMQFRYNSWAKPAGAPRYLANSPQGIFEWQYLATLYDGGDMAVRFAMDAVEHELRRNMWPIIMSNCHHFDVMIHISLMGSTLVDLQLYDETTDHGLIETNNLLGGLNSPIIGNISSLTHNAGQMYTAMGDTFATGAPSHGAYLPNNHPY